MTRRRTNHDLDKQIVEAADLLLRHRRALRRHRPRRWGQ
jgi:hypothetical protein